MAISHTGGHGGIDYGSIRGWEQVIANLNKEVLLISNGSRAGMNRAARFIQRDVESVPPLTPVDTNTLRSSFTVKDTHGEAKANVGSRTGNRYQNYGIQFGYPVNYALWVHEMVDADFTSPRIRYGPGKGRRREYIPRAGAGAKWLESSINRNHDTILQIIADGASKKA